MSRGLWEVTEIALIRRIRKEKYLMESLEDYINNPSICWLVNGPIDNDKLNEIYYLVEELVKYKANCLAHEYENLDISTEAIFCWKERTATLIYKPENDSEQDKTYNDIFKCLFIINSEYQNVIFLIYSQIEAILKHRINIKRRKSDYKNFKKKSKEEGELLLLYRYNLKIGYTVDSYIEDTQTFMVILENIIKQLNDGLRKERNSIAHDLIRIPSPKKIKIFLNAGINIEPSISETINSYIDSMNILLIKFKLLLIFFNKIFNITEDKHL